MLPLQPSRRLPLTEGVHGLSSIRSHYNPYQYTWHVFHCGNKTSHSATTKAMQELKQLKSSTRF